MIVNSLKDGWEIIYQRSHANLAAMLLAGWQKKDHIERWTELVVATAQHDDQEMFWSDSEHLTDIGAPLDFTQGTLDTRQMQAQLVIENARRQGLWIALLISMHNSFLYEPKRGEDKNLDAFLDQQQQNQEEWRKFLDYNKKETEREYAFLRWADRLSLILCRRQIPERERELDVAPHPDGTMIRLLKRPDDTLSLKPWILEKDELIVSIEVRRLHQLAFENEDEFLSLLDEAEVEKREWCFKK
ncbi:MAG: DUF3891 family protein [Phototrophicaceae bacterium]